MKYFLGSLLLLIPFYSISQLQANAKANTIRCSEVVLEDTLLIKCINEYSAYVDSLYPNDTIGNGYFIISINNSKFRGKEVLVSYHFDIIYYNLSIYDKGVYFPSMYTYINGRPTIISTSLYNKVFPNTRIIFPKKLERDINKLLNLAYASKYADHIFPHSGRTLYYFRDKEEAPYLDMHPY